MFLLISSPSVMRRLRVEYPVFLSHSVKIRPLGAEFHADGLTDRLEANTQIRNFWNASMNTLSVEPEQGELFAMNFTCNCVQSLELDCT
jgi:hypothetical protein